MSREPVALCRERAAGRVRHRVRGPSARASRQVPVTVETAAPGKVSATAAAVIVAIDGPSGTGKSSTSKAVAAQLGLSYLDTGAQYRAITWWMLTNGIDVDDPRAVAAAAGKPVIVSGTDPAAPTITVDGTDVSGADPHPGGHLHGQRGQRGARGARPDHRAAALHRRRRPPSGIVVEGRDIGTTVLPDADLKIFLTASPEARAARRSGELKGKEARTSPPPGRRWSSGTRPTPAARPRRSPRRTTRSRWTPPSSPWSRSSSASSPWSRRSGPRSDRSRPLPERGRRGRAAAIGIGLMYGLWKPRVLGAWRVPPTGPVDPGGQPLAQHRRPDADGHGAPAACTS